MKNFDDYTLAVKHHLKAQKWSDEKSILLKPSPAQLRNFCWTLASGELSKADEVIFRLFFNATDGDLLKAIDNIDVEKFKAVQNFLRSKNQNTNQKNLNLIAVLIDFKPRPFNRFMTEASDFSAHINDEAEVLKPLVYQRKTFKNSWLHSNKNKVGIGLIVIMALFLAGAAFTTEDDKLCMQWQTNHYELVNCEVAGVGNFSDIEPFDSRKSALKQITVTEKTTFFRNDIPLVYYSKRNNKCEFYNGPGVHPITGKQLRPITNYMINKYVLHHKK